MPAIQAQYVKNYTTQSNFEIMGQESVAMQLRERAGSRRGARGSTDGEKIPSSALIMAGGDLSIFQNDTENIRDDICNTKNFNVYNGLANFLGLTTGSSLGMLTG